MGQAGLRDTAWGSARENPRAERARGLARENPRAEGQGHCKAPGSGESGDTGPILLISGWSFSLPCGGTIARPMPVTL